MFKILLLINFIGTFVLSQNNNIFRLCVTDSKLSGRTCQAIQKGNSQVMCVPVTDSVNCAIKIQQNEADFALFTAEEALLVSKFISDDVEVIGHVRNRQWINESFAFQTVVVVRENFNGDFASLASMNYCHPGFGDGQFWSDRVLKEFENVVIPRSCNSRYSVLQQEMFSISNFFKSACRPGQWSLDVLVDDKLKSQFPSLCSLCDSSARCSYSDEAGGAHKAALNCLTKNGGDVAYVAYHRVKEYFGLLPGFQPRASQDEYKFLCPDGKTQALTDPCPWVQQPWSMVVAVKEKANVIASALPLWICRSANCKGKWQEAFTFIIEGDDNVYVQNVDTNAKLTDSLKGRSVDTEWGGDACRRVFRWCTTSADEYRKCEWLREAVITENIEPRISCVQSNRLLSCLDLIRKNQADVMGIDNDYSFAAKNVFNLSEIVYQDNSVEGNYRIFAVIRNDGKSFKTLGDLKGSKACFPRYGGLAWHSFVSKLYSVLPNTCPTVQAVSTFFSDACVPGVNDSDYTDFNISVPTNLCSLCARKLNSSKDGCEANYNNIYYDDFGAFSCLGIGKSSIPVADVAFVDFRNLFTTKYADFMKSLDKSQYSILCRNGTVVPMRDNTPNDCALSVGIGSSMIGRESYAKHENQDLVDLLLKINDRFGDAFSDYENVFRIFGPFNGSKGLLFSEHTVDLVVAHGENNDNIDSFIDLKKQPSKLCVIEKLKSDASIGSVSLLGFAFGIAAVFIA